MLFVLVLCCRGAGVDVKGLVLRALYTPVYVFSAGQQFVVIVAFGIGIFQRPSSLFLVPFNMLLLF